MKNRIAIMTLALSLSALPAFADTLLVHVNGMVCSFCAQGIDKAFRAEPSVQDVKVDLSNKLVTVQIRDGQSIPDEKVKSIIQDSGFALNSIEKK